MHTQTHQFSILFLLEGDRTVCRLASSSCTTIGRDRREVNVLVYQGEEQTEREEKGERGGGESGGGREEERETKRGRGRERWEGGKERRRRKDRETYMYKLTIFCLKETGLYAGLLTAAVPL